MCATSSACPSREQYGSRPRGFATRASSNSLNRAFLDAVEPLAACRFAQGVRSRSLRAASRSSAASSKRRSILNLVASNRRYASDRSIHTILERSKSDSSSVRLSANHRPLQVVFERRIAIASFKEARRNAIGTPPGAGWNVHSAARAKIAQERSQIARRRLADGKSIALLV